MTIRRSRSQAAVFLLAQLAVFAQALPVYAQDASQAFRGFSTNSDDPIQIEADRLEVRDNDKVAVYQGNVRVRQGETLLKTSELRVHYSGSATGSAPASGVDRIETGGPVTVRSGTQTASGDRAVFEMARELVTLSGNVVVADGDNVVRGNRLVVDLKARKASMYGGETATGDGRVQTVINPNRTRN